MNQEERLQKDGASDPILFYDADDPWGWMSSFADYPIEVPHPMSDPMALVTYSTREHYFQACKATTLEEHENIRTALYPGRAKARGRATDLRPDWGKDRGSLCWHVMVESIIAMVTQHPEIRAMLLETGDRYIYEDSPIDDIWGWRYYDVYDGKNLLGLAWMHVRALLQHSIAKAALHG